MEQIRIGWAEADITPYKRVSLAGQFAERISEYVEKPLTVTALAMENGDDQVVLVSADIIQLSWVTMEKIRRQLADNGMGLDPAKIIVSAIHTHCGPNLGTVRQSRRVMPSVRSIRDLMIEMLPPGRNYVAAAKTTAPDIITAEEFEELFVERVSRAILEAWKNRKPGGFVNAFGRAAVGQCRRAVYTDGSAMMWGETNTAVFRELEGGNDSGVELLYCFGENRELTGVVVNLACPAQCVQHRLFVSPDFWGEVKVRLRAHFGEHIFVLPQCSAAGDQCPVDLIRWVEPESDVHDPNITRAAPLRRKADPSMFDLAGMRKVGKRIANEVIDVYEEGLGEITECAPLEHRMNISRLPLRRVSREERNAALRSIRQYMEETTGDVNYNDTAMLQVHLGVLNRYELQERMDVVDTEVHVVRLGEIAFATNPFEMFLDYGNQIKARSRAAQTFVVQLANGCEGYLPTEKAERGGHYSAFVGSGQVGHVGGEQLVRETLTEIRALFPDA